MEPIVDLAPGAELSVLARFYSERVRESIKKKRRRAVFFSMKATIFVVDFDSGNATTLRFDHGRLTLHEGTIGMPSVTFGGPLRALLSLDKLRLREIPAALVGRTAEVTLVDRSESRSVPPPPPSNGPPSSRRSPRADLKELARLLASGEVKIYGLWSHPRTVARFLRLISSSPELS